MAKFIGSKYFKSSGLDKYDMPQSMVDGIRRIEKKIERLGNNQQRILANVLIHQLPDVELVFDRYLSVVASGGNSGSRDNLIFIYGEEVGEKIANVRSENSVSAGRGGKDLIEYFVDCNSDFMKLGITYQTLTTTQKLRLRRVLDRYSLDELSDFKKPIANFIKYDLTSYVGRVTRIKASNSRGVYGYILRYGKVAGLAKFDEDSEKRKTGLCNQESRWLGLGYSSEESIRLIREHNTKAAIAAAGKYRGTSLRSVRSKDYWLNKGLSDTEASAEVRRVQDHWRKLSETERTERIINWLGKMNDKTDDEKELINLKKSHLPLGVMARLGCSIEEATLESERIFKNRNCFSKISQKFFWAVSDALGSAGLYFQELNKEILIENKYVDFYDSISKTVVEFHGVYWHARDLDDDFLIYGRTAKEIRSDDVLREQLITSSEKVNQYVIVWEDQYRKNPEATVKSITNLIRTNRETHDKTTIY